MSNEYTYKSMPGLRYLLGGDSKAMNNGAFSNLQIHLVVAFCGICVACTADYKWIIYDKNEKGDGLSLKGHVITSKPDVTEYREEVKGGVKFSTPFFDENDRVLIIVDDKKEAEKIKKCIVEEKEVGQKVDNPVAPQLSPQSLPQSSVFTKEQTSVLLPPQIANLSPDKIPDLSPHLIKTLSPESIQAFNHEQIWKFTADQVRAFTPEQIKAFKPDQIGHFMSYQIQNLSLASAKALTEAQIKAMSSRQLEALQPSYPTSIPCELDLRHKGGFLITYKLSGDNEGKNILLQDNIKVHELYRFRVIAAPVWTTLQKRDKKYSLRTNSAGQSEVIATARQDHPANYTLMLQAYWWKPRDVLDPPRWGDWKDGKELLDILLQKVNPVIGINLINPNPLNHFYTGLSLEAYPGFDIVAGAHWAKTDQLTAGFAQGQTTTIPPATKERFNNGWFVGVGVDIGVMATWLKYIGQAIPSLQ